MRPSTLERGFLVLAAVGFTASFYVFARFTVDDAFISWAYGKNLALHGAWSYCPDALERVEAYTSIVYAALATVPEALGIDVVLFFKLVSIAVLAYLVFDRVAGTSGFARVAAALLFASPLFVLHLFSGLETVMFGATVFAAVRAIQLERPCAGAVIGTFSFFVRPEGLVLAGLCWTAALLRSPTRHTVATVCACVAAIGGYLAFRITEFGALLPHTYYAKSRGSFDVPTFARGAWLVLPPMLMFRPSEGRSPSNLAVGILAMLGLAEAFAYASSTPIMNYGERFFFHIYVPVALFATMPANVDALASNLRLDGTPARIVLGVFLALTLTRWTAAANLQHYATYYPRLLDSHAALGRALGERSDGHSHALVFGDAGALAYAADWESIDNIGIASKAIRDRSFNVAFLDRVSPAIVIFHSEPGTGLRLHDYHQETMWKFVQARSYPYVCTAVWSRSYELAVYASPEFVAAHPSIRTRLEQVCRSSRERNLADDDAYLMSTLHRAPFEYWHR